MIVMTVVLLLLGGALVVYLNDRSGEDSGRRGKGARAEEADRLLKRRVNDT
ncbi:hypothetical protein AWB82_04191 [Caballeronia glebae]|uniref:Uncharacterized protein n=1 Tax=Caballeronia glebae TaxID=1777143 RepID=A0A158BJE6_9BURK|nr:hypothetical protein AWB82_04191 [Caballeronia glebae]